MSETRGVQGGLLMLRLLKLRQTVFRRRQRRFSAYVFWLVAYGVTVWFYVGDAVIQQRQTLPLLIPVAVVIVQMIYPTLFGWTVIAVPTFVYAVIGVYYLICNVVDNQWAYDRQGLVLGVVFVIAYVGVCIALVCGTGRSDK